MNGTLESARQKLQNGKDIFSKAGMNQSMLKEALISVSAALDDYIDASPPSNRSASSGYRVQAGKDTDRPLKRKLNQLQDDRIINGDDRKAVLDMHWVRNRIAHGEPQTVSREELRRAIVVTQRIIERDSLHKRMVRGGKKRSSGKVPATEQNSTTPRASSSLPIRRGPQSSPPESTARHVVTMQQPSTQRQSGGHSSTPARRVTEAINPEPNSSRKAESNEEFLRRLLEE